MNITVNETIHLYTTHSQLSFLLLESGHLCFAYLGNRMESSDLGYVVEELQRASYLADTDGRKDFKLEQLPLAYPGYGNPDMRSPAHQEIYADGSMVSDFRYVSHEYTTKKQPLKGLPYATAEMITCLTFKLRDEVTGNELHLSYTAYEAYDVFTQSVVFKNLSKTSIRLEEILSFHFDLLSDKFEMITLNGAWGRENNSNRRPLVQGTQGCDSKRGASGHGQNPFLAFVTPETTETSGQVIAATLLYSGNFKAAAEVDMHQNTRIQLGINPFNFSWKLGPNEVFQTPEAAFLSTEHGLNDMSQKFHRFFQECLIRSIHRDKARPILVNNWEATYFDFDKEKIYMLAREAKKIGAELFVLDDGWFGRREDDTSSLGDWFANEEKLKGSLAEFIEGIREMGLQFGLWIEPEMLSENSRLFEKHPDWVVKIPHRTPQKIRHQYVLDLTRKEVQDHLIQVLDALFSTHSIDYVKWDMNRNLTDIYSSTLSEDRQQEFSHRYILGLYRILEELTQKHTNILFESCAGGGGRFDGGMLFYTPQIWTSDDTDAVERVRIQKGTSLIYPPVTMGCHVSAVPNHQVGRTTSLETRTLIAQQGNFGYELDLLNVSAEEKELIAQQVACYKEERQLLQFGKQWRLPVYDESNESAWQKMNEAKDELVVVHIQFMAKANTVSKRLRLLDLEPDAVYQIGKEQRTGNELMKIGLMIPRATNDYFGTKWKLRKVVDNHANIKIDQYARRSGD